MKRYRFTLFAICLFLLWLGGNDLWLALRNPSPAPVAAESLLAEGPPRDWLTVTGGTLDLVQAISTSGSIELDALLVPLRANPDDPTVSVLVETREPKRLQLFATYHFRLDSEAERAAFLAEHASELREQADVTGLLASGLIARGNRNKLHKLALEVDMPLGEQVLFLSEGKTPELLRGLFFFTVGIAGFLTVLAQIRPGPQQTDTAA